jgi:hypothetical protein
MPKRRIILELEQGSEQLNYLDACARIRQVHISVLVRRLINTIATEQMVLNVLDDDSRPYRETWDHAYREPLHG